MAKKKKKKNTNINKKEIIVIVIVLIILVFVLLCLLKKDEPDTPTNENKIEEIKTDQYKITYYYSNSYGKKADTVPRVISIDQDGHVIISLTDEEIGVEALEYDLDKKKVKSLVDYINEKKILTLDSNLGTECMDGISEYFTVKVNDTSNKIGGRCVSNKSFRDLVSFYLDVIDKAKLDKFNKAVDMMYEEM